MLPDIYKDKCYKYINKKCSSMTNTEIDACIDLFLNNYGIWSNQYNVKEKRGKKIKITRKLLDDQILNLRDSYVAIVKLGDEFVGYSFYILRKINESQSPIAFILQLVVSENHRGKRIGRSLMFSIWGISDCYAWGLYTSNPFTIKSLEDCTFRKISIQKINQEIDNLKQYLNDILPQTNWLDSYSNGVVNTKFFVDHSKIQQKKHKAYPGGKFPFEKYNLDEGYEWLAIIFKDQKISHLNEKNIEQLLNVSNTILQFAYSQMNMTNQPWAKYQKKEIDYLTNNKYINKNEMVLDVGCGQGRHTIELLQRGYKVLGIDFSDENICKAKEQGKNIGISDFAFKTEDIRTYKNKNKFGTVLCLYDVIGSFTDDKENDKIIINCFKNLKNGGILVLSVMNMDLTESICLQDRFIEDMHDPGTFKNFLKSRTSSIMQQTGNIFNPDYFFFRQKKKHSIS